MEYGRGKFKINCFKKKRFEQFIQELAIISAFRGIKGRIFTVLSKK
jgi:hypothetical protein